MESQRVIDAGDPRVHDFVALTDVALRRRQEPVDGLFLAEGERVIRRALAAGYALRSVFCEDRWVAPLADVLRPLGSEVYVADAEVLATVTGYAVHRGALASFDRRPLPSVAEVLASARRVAVLEDMNDHTNIGAVFRSAAALGVDAVLLTPRCADPLYRRSVKVSMGAVFAVPYARFARWPAGLAQLRDAGMRVLALTPARDALPVSQLTAADTGRTALLIGAEGPGLRPDVLAAADLRVGIPMRNGVDSLNAAAAAAVAFYALQAASGYGDQP